MGRGERRMNTERRLMKNQCDKCPYFKDIFGNYVQCVKTGRFINYEYWHNELPDDCPLPECAERTDNDTID